MLAAFHLNLTALSWVALVVGLFLVYNTVTISVIARRDEIGVLARAGRDPGAGAGAVSRRSRRARAGRRRARASGSGGSWRMRPSASPRPRSARSTSRPPPHRLPGGLARRAGAGDRHSVVAAGRRGARPRREPRATDGGDARQRSPRDAAAPAAIGAVLPVRRPGRRLRPVAARAGERPAALRLCVLVCHHHRRVAAGAGNHLRARPRAARAARAAAGRRGRAGARQPGRRDSAAVDLRVRAGRQPLDDGGRGGDDRQLQGHGRLLDRPDAAGRSLRRPGYAADGGVGADAVGAGDGRRAAAIPASTPSTRSGTSISSTTATWSCSAPATSTSCCHTARCCSRRPPTDGRCPAASHRHRSR